MILTPQGLKSTSDNHIIPVTNITGLHKIEDIYMLENNNMVILIDEEEDNITQQISGDKLIENEQTQQFQDKIDKYSRIYFPDQPQYIIGKKNKKNEIYIYNLISNQETFLGSIRANENCSDYECFGDKYFISLRDRTLYFSRAQNLKSLYSFKLQKYLEKIEIQNKILIMKEGFLYKQIYFCIKTSNKIKLFRKFNIKYYRDYKVKINGRDIIFPNINNKYTILDLANFKIKGYIISEHINKLRDQLFIKQYGLFVQLFQNNLYIYDSNFKQLALINIKKLVGICNNPRWVKYGETQGFTIFHDYKT